MGAIKNTLLGCILAAGLSTTACDDACKCQHDPPANQSVPENNNAPPEYDAPDQDPDSIDNIVDQEPTQNNEWDLAGYGDLTTAPGGLWLNRAAEHSYVHIDAYGKETKNVRIAGSSLHDYEWRFLSFQNGWFPQTGILGEDRGGDIFFPIEGWPDHSYAGNILLWPKDGELNEGYWLCTDENHHIIIRKHTDGNKYITFEIKDGILDYEYDHVVSEDFILSGNKASPPPSPPSYGDDDSGYSDDEGGSGGDLGFDSAMTDNDEGNVDSEVKLYLYNRLDTKEYDPRVFGASPGLDYFKKHEYPEDPIVGEVLSETFLNGGRLYFVKTASGQVMVPGSEPNSAVLIGSGHWNKLTAAANSDWGQNHFKDESWYRMVPVGGEKAAIPNASSYYTLVNLVNTKTGRRGKLFHNGSTGETIGIHGKLCDLYSAYSSELGLPLRLIDYGWGKGFVTCANGYAMVSDTEFKIEAPGINVSGTVNDKPLTLSEIAFIAGELVSWILPTPSPVDVKTLLDKNSSEYARKWALGGLGISLVPFGCFAKELKSVKKAVKKDDFLQFISTEGIDLTDPLLAGKRKIIVDKSYEDLFGPLMRKSDQELFDITRSELNDVFVPRRNFASNNLKDLYWKEGSQFKGIFYEPNLLTGFSETKKLINYSEPNIWMLFEEWMHADDFIKGAYDGVDTYIKKHLIALDNMEKALREGHPVAKKIFERGYEGAALMKDGSGKNVFDRVREQLIKYAGLDEILDGAAEYGR